MKENKILNVFNGNKKVGTLLLTNDNRIGFAYDEEWIRYGYSISPFSLPLKSGVFICKKNYFEGLYGVFGDSLPDSWGKLLLNRMLLNNKINIKNMNILDKLSIIGSNGMGSLEYKPEYLMENYEKNIDLDKLSLECQKILLSEYSEDLDIIYKMGGSSGGARPKILTKIDDEDWIIKFNSHVDDINIGKIEYEYYLCAIKCGIHMMESRLFSSKINSGYFGTKRFDRVNGKKVHMISVAALLELDYEAPSLDYSELMKLVKILTDNNLNDILQMFRRMCFNVFAHNRDDHTKNFSFIYNEDEHKYRLSPAYDLTYSNTYFGEHTTSINGNGKNPTEEDLIYVGTKAGLNKTTCIKEISKIRECVLNSLGKYLV